MSEGQGLKASRDHAPSTCAATEVEPLPPVAQGDIFGASGKNYSEPEPPWKMPTPTTVSSAKDGHPSGRHMIDGYRMMGAAARVSGGKYQKEMAEVYEAAALCIENEAARADRAEAVLAAMGSNSVAREHSSPRQVVDASPGDAK